MFEPTPEQDRAQQRRSPRAAQRPLRRPRRTLAHAVISFGAKSFVMLLMCWALCFNFSEVRGGSMTPGI